MWDVYNIYNILVFFIFFYIFETFSKNLIVVIQYTSTNQVYFSKIQNQKLPKSKLKPNIKNFYIC